jgi:nucleoside-diphosphate-sugar epimerase
VKDTILLTGATGALGSMLLQRLSDQGYEVVCLVRGKTRAEARKRIRDLVGERQNVKVIRGDITEPRCGISDLDREHLFGRVKRVLHCAASINFMDKNETQVTNVAGLLHVLELTDILDAWHVIHVSTAYVIGDAPYLSEDSLSLNQRWYNPYEESKFIGEKMVRAWALKRDERRFTIMRPSILIGCEDGTTPTLDTFYRYGEPLHRVAESLRERRGESPSPDISVSADGRVRMPLAILMADKRVNYVPIDWAADMMAAAVDLPPRNETLHFVHNQPPRLRDIMMWSANFLKIEGFVVCATPAAKELAIRTQSPFVRRLQRRIDVVHDAYIPYVTTEPHFQMEAAPRGLGTRFRYPPPIDQKFIERLLSYARQWHWNVDRKRHRVDA